VRSSFSSAFGPASAEADASGAASEGAALGTLATGRGVSFASSGVSIEPHPAISSAPARKRMVKFMRGRSVAQDCSGIVHLEMPRSSPRRPLQLAAAAGSLLLAGCGGTDFVKTEYEAQPLDKDGGWLDGPPRVTASAAQPAQTPGERRAGSFRNTYYDFPREGAGKKDSKVFDASCKAIADVPKEFHDQVCLQGSGKLASGQTISFAKRDCACAAECPKSKQKICFEALDPKLFPSGRGAMGQAVTPMRTIAVDDTIIPLGTVVYILEYDGLPRPDGSAHDGCFVAEDRGSAVQGQHIDIFTGDPATTKSWNQLVPSNGGVHVEVNAPRCEHLNSVVQLKNPKSPGAAPPAPTPSKKP
jgi:3D (Asp-Asp-Asp) domain-containing protein